MELSRVVPDRSFAYRAKKSTTMCVNEIFHRIAVLKNDGYKVVGMSLDIENAYNCVDVSTLAKQLKNLKVNATYIKFIDRSSAEDE